MKYIQSTHSLKISSWTISLEPDWVERGTTEYITKDICSSLFRQLAILSDSLPELQDWVWLPRFIGEV